MDYALQKAILSLENNVNRVSNCTEQATDATTMWNAHHCIEGRKVEVCTTSFGSTGLVRERDEALTGGTAMDIEPKQYLCDLTP